MIYFLDNCVPPSTITGPSAPRSSTITGLSAPPSSTGTGPSAPLSIPSGKLKKEAVLKMLPEFKVY